MSGTARAKELFLDALELPASERGDFLDRTCGESAELREEIERLLAAHDKADGVLGDESRTPQSGALGALASRVLEELELGPGDELGDYRIEAEIGEGGFGRVFRAEQLRPMQRRVALKVLKLGMDSGQVMARFEAERRVLARMEHPDIARVLDAGTTTDGRPYFVMELVEGQPITRYCEQRGLGLAERLELFRSACLAIQHAHAKGVLHRDVKPSNVLVTEVDGEPRPRVIDFGVAKAIASPLDKLGELVPGLAGSTQLTAEGHLVGTPAYMSPEQMDTAADVDTRSDVYALGVLLYELVAGAPPFETEATGVAALVDLRQQVSDTEPIPPSRARGRRTAAGPRPKGVAGAPGRLPAEVDWIALRAIERERELRYPTAAALAADTERLLAGLPVDAAPRGAGYRLRKLIQRYRAASLFAAAALVALLLGVVGTTLGMVRARDALALAESEANEARAQSEIAEAVNDFLTRDLLSSARPSLEQGTGRDARMSEVVQRAADQLDRSAAPGGRLADKPRVEGRLRLVIGQTLTALGKAGAAAPQLERARELFERELGELHVDTLRARLDLADANFRDPAHGGPGSGLSGLVELMNRELGPGHATTLRAVDLLADSLHRGAGRTREAAVVVEQGLAAAREAGVEETSEMGHMLATAAVIRADLGETAAAEELFRESVGVLQRTEGTLSRGVLVTRVNLAVLLARMKRQDEAYRLFDELVPLLREALGAEHHQTVMAMGALASLKHAFDLHDEGLELAQAAHAAQLERFGPDHRETRMAASMLAISLASVGRRAEGLELQREVVAATERDHGPLAPMSLHHAGNLAVMVFEGGDTVAAEPLVRSVLERSDAVRPRSDPFSVMLTSLLGGCRRAAGDEVEAELLLMEALERGAELPDHANELRQARIELSGVCRDQERWEEALELLEINRAAIAEFYGVQDPRYAENAARIVDVLVRAGWLDDARAVEDELGERLDAVLDLQDLLRVPR